MSAQSFFGTAEVTHPALVDTKGYKGGHQDFTGDRDRVAFTKTGRACAILLAACLRQTCGHFSPSVDSSTSFSTNLRTVEHGLACPFRRHLANRGCPAILPAPSWSLSVASTLQLEQQGQLQTPLPSLQVGLSENKVILSEFVSRAGKALTRRCTGVLREGTTQAARPTNQPYGSLPAPVLLFLVALQCAVVGSPCRTGAGRL